jgi:hypothetical protein
VLKTVKLSKRLAKSEGQFDQEKADEDLLAKVFKKVKQKNSKEGRMGAVKQKADKLKKHQELIWQRQ